MIFSNTSWRCKETGEIVTLIGLSWGTDGGSTVSFAGGDGISETMTENEFKEMFEPIILDFHSIKDQLAELCLLSNSFAEIGKIAMKKLDPTYFEVGKLVYISNTTFIQREDHKYYYGGPDHPYVIKYIRPVNHGRDLISTIEIGISLEGKKREDEIDYTFPIHPARLDVGDAYWFLSRYDKPY